MITRQVYGVIDPFLRQFIDSYWAVSFSELEGVEELNIPPMGFPVFHIHYGVDSNCYNREDFLSKSVIFGQMTRHVILFGAPGLKILGVNFKPYGLYNLFGISPLELVDSGILSSTLFGEENINSLTAYITEYGPERAINEIESLFIQFQINGEKVKSNHLMDSIVDEIIAEHGLVDIKDLIGNKICFRNVERYFTQVIGIPYKLFSQILRHKFIMEQLYLNENIKWSSLVLNGFYYDFSHFTRDFRHFTGLTPARYIPLINNYTSIILKK